MSNKTTNHTSCQTPVSGSALIAEFMGCEKYRYGDKIYVMNYMKDKPFYIPSLMQYDQSWDWFMPVYKKIRDIVSDRLKCDKNTITTLDLLGLDVQISVAERNLKKAFDCAVKFVVCYNACQADLQLEYGRNKIKNGRLLAACKTFFVRWQKYF